MNESLVYFLKGIDTAHGDIIRIGYSDHAEARLGNHARNGMQLLAAVPATEQSERFLHTYFKPFLVGRDSSTYHHNDLFPYVERLLHWGFAAPTLEEFKHWSRPDFRLWRPDRIEAPMWDGNQGALFVSDGMKADARDCYETPEEIVEVCRRALGGAITTDPCSNATANRRICAETFYTEAQDGLKKPWFGTVLLNPPYGGGKEPGAARFTAKLVDEIRRDNVAEAITILNLQSMPTIWFPIVWKNAVAHGVWKKRIDFIRPRTATGSKPFSSSKNGTIFSYFGRHPDRFMKEFAHFAMVWKCDL